MRVVFHRVAHDVRHLVVPAVFELVHAVQDAAVYGLQAVIDVGDGALKDDVAGVIEKPVAIEGVHRLVLHRGGGGQDGGEGFVSGFFGGLFGHGGKGEWNGGARIDNAGASARARSTEGWSIRLCQKCGMQP